ncbi:epidermal growth factor receptor isoform X2 [Chelonus insularis]|uniref:epidermal growth factor receptor isoform X2 n=1 Tax=Chelonus insularis TaxID=460826 RepID=UPI001588B380|nr:epidermal growth factor receptor isoform X2 [Chelonus insularis]XP_034936587.1 epidermal growth factor receptor isoform X2 [Chelonus insularis]XP_034936588.1 epidermal growth factor receptor isoform X2 [Chelonus insularis]
MNHQRGHEPSSWTLSTFHICVIFFLVAILGSNQTSADPSSEFVKGKICIGTNGRLSVPSNKQHHYRNLRDRYTNCTYVDGNLEITWLQNDSLDLSFLQYIREVTGYVLISHVDVRRVVLPRLQIIRGRTLFKLNIHDNEFALFVTMCQMYNLEMPALRDILSGSVGMFNNYNLCHIKTINWDEIITGLGGRYFYVYNFTSPERTCPECDRSCEQGCWGEGPENCQKFSKTNCSPQCWQGRCFGPNPRECCHLFCAGGCTGPKQSDCLACKSFLDDGVCTLECPPMQKYNPTTYSWEANPDGKYAYGATCVRKCPEHLLRDNGACVRSCPPKKKALNGECVPCDGPCPKTCLGVDPIHSGNIDQFRDCTIYEGSINIMQHTFDGYQHILPNFTFGSRYGPMHPDRLEIFSTLKEVTGYINIQAHHPAFTNLSYFRNLEIIGGRQLTEYFASLYIVKTALVSLGLRSLKKINSGSIIVLENKDLCYAQTIDWSRIKNSSEHESLLSNNRNESECVKDGLVCDEQCSSEGCWGPGPSQCLSCKNFMLDNVCIESCSIIPGIYQSDARICKRCHEECDGSCDGPNAEHCTKCKHLRDGPFCVKECPSSKYNDNGHCKSCHENCVGGCEGPENNIGPNGCHSCVKAIMNGHVPEGCLQKREPCPEGYYYEWVSPQEQGSLKPLAGKAVCRKCHARCKKCTGYGVHEQVCQQCVKYKRDEHCEDECPADHYVEVESQLCIPCSSECRSCYGPGSNQCHKCRNFKLYLESTPPYDNTTRFNCTETCPSEVPHKIFPPDDEPYCSFEPVLGSSHLENEFLNRPLVLAIIGGVMTFVMIAGAIIMWQWRLKTKAKENTVKMTMALTGLDDNEPLRPTGVKPNLAKLRIIKEEEMRKGGILGYGAFGNVYKGVWVPEGENVKIPVAIKVLHDNTGANTSKEFLDEAYIMASVEHPNLLQLLAVCMTSQMMLVTQLMPLGCLLDFVRTYKDKIGSKPLLNWSTQIARGMAYLEERRLVHRDLAARNVLVQTANCVKITDFGLAKLLDINEEQYKAAGGKMPIKWLALECIQHRVFTHKSDVWAFGVTIWEVFTYGERPYDNVPARNVPELLEKGERLPQPAICSIDVYMIMIKCWMLDAESRPSFKELADDFAKMSRDPGRYLAIKGDKYMRLPSYTLQDEKEMIRHLTSTVEDPEALVDGDEYLQPKSRAPIPPRLAASSIVDSPPPTPVKTSWPNGTLSALTTDSPTPQNQQNWDRELLTRYNAGTHTSESASNKVPNRQRIQHQTNCTHPSDQNCRSVVGKDGKSRYCSDPLKIIGGTRDCDVTDDGFQTEATNVHQQAQVGGLKLDLPLDEDDYLMPSPQIPTNAAQYMDLIGDTKPTESDPKVVMNGYRTYPEFTSIAGKTSLDNPEYLMSQDGPLSPQIIGIPTVDLDRVLTGGTFGSQVKQRCSEEESDHEYYNDFDRLERELQPLKPLRKNETTV